MTSVSAKMNRVISNSRSANRALYLLLIVSALAFSACGDEEQTPAQQLADSVSAATGATDSAGATGSTAKATESKKSKSESSKEKSSSDSKSTPKNSNIQVPNSEKPQQEIDSAEPSRISLTLTLKNGKFASTTPMMPIVPSGIQIDLDVYVKDDRSYRLLVNDGTGRATETPVFPKAGIYTYSRIGVMTDDQVATVRLGDQKIEITAGAEAGP